MIRVSKIRLTSAEDQADFENYLVNLINASKRVLDNGIPLPQHVGICKEFSDRFLIHEDLDE